MWEGLPACYILDVPLAGFWICCRLLGSKQLCFRTTVSVYCSYASASCQAAAQDEKIIHDFITECWPDTILLSLCVSALAQWLLCQESLG